MVKIAADGVFGSLTCVCSASGGWQASVIADDRARAWPARWSGPMIDLKGIANAGSDLTVVRRAAQNFMMSVLLGVFLAAGFVYFITSLP
jgi:hypothetical protein